MDSINRVPVTARVLKLRQEVIDAKPILDSDRAMIVTEHYKATEDMHYIKRRATTLYEILKCIHINIWEDELIVGSHGGNGRKSATTDRKSVV